AMRPVCRRIKKNNGASDLNFSSRCEALHTCAVPMRSTGIASAQRGRGDEHFCPNLGGASQVAPTARRTRDTAAPPPGRRGVRLRSQTRDPVCQDRDGRCLARRVAIHARELVMTLAKLVTGIALAAFALCHAVSGARADACPVAGRPLKLVVPFAPGGGVDVLARLYAEALKDKFGTVVVENRGGANGTLGGQIVHQAAPDGYTLLFSASTH